MKEKFLYQPISPFILTQGFGEDKACLQIADGKTVISKQTSETCPAGYKSLYSNTNGHNGLDIRAYRWQPVYASHDGIVNEVQTEVARGLGVGIVSDFDVYCDTETQDLIYSKAEAVKMLIYTVGGLFTATVVYLFILAIVK